jgi:hypothetical protein
MTVQYSRNWSISEVRLRPYVDDTLEECWRLAQSCKEDPDEHVRLWSAYYRG